MVHIDEKVVVMRGLVDPCTVERLADQRVRSYEFFFIGNIFTFDDIDLNFGAVITFCTDISRLVGKK